MEDAMVLRGNYRGGAPLPKEGEEEFELPFALLCSASGCSNFASRSPACQRICSWHRKEGGNNGNPSVFRRDSVDP